MIAPSELQVIGRDLAIRWQNGHESFICVARLRAASPSAEVQGEQDIFGQVRGGGAGPGPTDVSIVGWKQVGNYAIQFQFSDGHQTGIYTFDYLRRLGDGEEPA